MVLWVTNVYRAVAELMDAPDAITLTLNVIVVMVFLETLADFVIQRSDTRPMAPHRDANRDVRRIMARIVRVAAYIAALVVVAEAWAVDMLGIVDQSSWRSTALEWVDTGATLFLAYVAWEAIEFVTGKYGGRPTIALQPVAASPELPSSRGVTLMPLVRTALLTIIAVAVALVVLSELGANITPLIAGASIFGLAISFGSQALVRDIVSGVFYLAEDAFRIGEYIDCGKAKGTVEGFALRSLRLRHQNGQVHTLPFGQLGLITNYSRDWTTVKFALRFARTTDMEILRKATKRIGEEMMVDPEFANDFLEPLKMQGVDDITDNAIVVRFKFTVRPTQPSTIQRDAIKRMMITYRDAGISFADATVAVQTVQRADRASSAAAASSRGRGNSW